MYLDERLFKKIPLLVFNALFSQRREISAQPFAAYSYNFPFNLLGFIRGSGFVTDILTIVPNAKNWSSI